MNKSQQNYSFANETTAFSGDKEKQLHFAISSRFLPPLKFQCASTVGNKSYTCMLLKFVHMLQQFYFPCNWLAKSPTSGNWNSFHVWWGKISCTSHFKNNNNNNKKIQNISWCCLWPALEPHTPQQHHQLSASCLLVFDPLNLVLTQVDLLTLN